MTPPKPDLAWPSAEQVPAELRPLRRWIGWRLLWDESKQKWKKPPHSTLTGKAIGATKEYQDDWQTFDGALEGARHHGLDGVGFVFAEGDGFVGVDFDDCRDPETGEIHPAAASWLKWFKSTYQETSPSGTGVHAIGRGKLAHALTATRLEDSDATVEMYDHGRYFTFTGEKIGEATTVSPIQPAVDKLLAHLGQETRAAGAGDDNDRPMSKLAARKIYEDYLEKLRNAAQGQGNELVNTTAWFAARAFAAGVLEESENAIKQTIRDIVTREWRSPHPQPGADQSIDSGWNSGIGKPLAIKEPDFPEADETIEEFDKRFFHIRNYGNKARIGEMKVRNYGEGGRRDRYLSTRSVREFQNGYLGDKIVCGLNDDGTPKLRTKAEVWLDRRHRTYEEVVYRPGQQTPPEVFNLWTGFAYEPKKGDCSLYLRHVRENVCRGNITKYKIVMSWMAEAVRYPGRHGNWAIAVRGKKGVGKNVFAEPFIDLWGEHGIVVAGEHAVTSNFNAHLLNKSALLADEALFAGDAKQDRIIKGLITGATLRIEPKGIDSFNVPNLLHTIIVGNDQRLVRATADERRYFALECGDSRRGSQEYFGAILRQMSNGGHEALLWHLLNEVTVFEMHDAPQTETLKEQMSGEPVEEMWVECLASGRLPALRDVAKNYPTSRQVAENKSWTEKETGFMNLRVADLVEWAHRQRRRGWDSVTHDDVTGLLGAKGLDLTKSTTISRDGVKTRYWRIPPLADCRENWNRRKYQRNWPDDGGEWEEIVETRF